MNEYLEFRETTPKEKTKVWNVYSLNDKDSQRLGHIQWYGQWRKYCFFPNAHTVWDTNCLKELSNFLYNQTELHRLERKKKNG